MLVDPIGVPVSFGPPVTGLPNRIGSGRRPAKLSLPRESRTVDVAGTVPLRTITGQSGEGTDWHLNGAPNRRDVVDAGAQHPSALTGASTMTRHHSGLPGASNSSADTRLEHGIPAANLSSPTPVQVQSGCR